jgi:hypothetical protein
VVAKAMLDLANPAIRERVGIDDRFLRRKRSAFP